MVDPFLHKRPPDTAKPCPIVGTDPVRGSWPVKLRQPGEMRETLAEGAPMPARATSQHGQAHRVALAARQLERADRTDSLQGQVGAGALMFLEYSGHPREQAWLEVNLDGPGRVTASDRAIESLFGTENDARLAYVVWRHFHIDLVAGKNADVVLSHFSGNMAEHDVSILKFDLESGTREVFQYFALHCDNVVFAICILVNAAIKLFSQGLERAQPLTLLCHFGYPHCPTLCSIGTLICTTGSGRLTFVLHKQQAQYPRLERLSAASSHCSRQ
jgi:hypothetical protein